MRTLTAVTLLLLPAAANTQAVQPGPWDITSTAVTLQIPGAPAFLLRMMKGKSKSERKCVSPAQAADGVAALLAPDPKAQCHVDSQQIAGGLYHQALTCPQTRGPPIRITRSGTYGSSGFAGRLDMDGQTQRVQWTSCLTRKPLMSPAHAEDEGDRAQHMRIWQSSDDWQSGRCGPPYLNHAQAT